MADRRWRKATTALVFLAALAEGTAAAARWVVESDITLTQTYSDRRSLTALPDDDGFSTMLQPSLRLRGGGARFRADLRYAPTAIFSSASHSDRFVNTLDGSANLEAVDSFFYVDANAHVTQTFISPFEPRPQQLFIDTENRIEARNFSISPYVRSNLRGLFDYEVRHRSSWSQADNRALADIYTNQWTARVASPILRLGWALEFDDTNIDYDGVTGTRLERHSRLYRGRVYLQPNPEWRFQASAGTEENNYTLEERSYDIYGLGLLWRPGPRTSLELEWEERFFGASRLARFAHRTRLTTWSIHYSRNTGDFQQELLTLPPGNTAAILDAIFAARIPDPLERQLAVQEFLRVTGTPPFLAAPLSFYTQQVLLTERAEASAGIVGKRNSVIFNLFRSETTDLLAGLGTAGPDNFLFGDRIEQHGFGLRSNHQLTPHTSLGAGATRTYSEQDASSREARNDLFIVSLNWRMSPKTTASAGASLTRFDSSDAAFDSPDVRSVFVTLTHHF